MPRVHVHILVFHSNFFAPPKLSHELLVSGLASTNSGECYSKPKSIMFSDAPSTGRPTPNTYIKWSKKKGFDAITNQKRQNILRRGGLRQHEFRFRNEVPIILTTKNIQRWEVRLKRGH